MDRFVERFSLSKSNIAPYSSRPVQILMLPEESDHNQTITRTAKVTDGSEMAVNREEQGPVARIARSTTLQPMSRTYILVYATASKCVQVELHTPLGPYYQYMEARRMIEVLHWRAVTILIVIDLSFVINLMIHQPVAIRCPRYLISSGNEMMNLSRTLCYTTFAIPSLSCTASRHLTVSNKSINTIRWKNTLTSVVALGERNWQLSTNARSKDPISWKWYKNSKRYGNVNFNV